MRRRTQQRFHGKFSRQRAKLSNAAYGSGHELRLYVFKIAEPETDRLLYPETPDGRYFVVRGRLWRMSDPRLDPQRRAELVHELMAARRAVRDTRKEGGGALADARARVDAAKHALGERGPVWWNDGAPDLNRRMVHNTPYAEWYEREAKDGRDS